MARKMIDLVRSRARSMAKQDWGGPNWMKQFYADAGCAAWAVDGWGHGGIIVGVWDSAQCRLNVSRGSPSVYKYTTGQVAFVLYVFEEDVSWAYFMLDNQDPNLIARWLKTGGWKPDQITAAKIAETMDAARRTEASYPFHG